MRQLHHITPQTLDKRENLSLATTCSVEIVKQSVAHTANSMYVLIKTNRVILLQPRNSTIVCGARDSRKASLSDCVLSSIQKCNGTNSDKKNRHRFHPSLNR